MAKQSTMWSRVSVHLFHPMDIASLAVVRMLFGIIIMMEAFRYMDLARMISKYNQADFNFKYYLFEWVEVLSVTQMQWVHIAYGLAGLCIFLGIFYHAAILFAFLATSYLFLVDSTNYLNHMYLVIVFTAMMFFIPAYKGWSLYALIHKNADRDSAPAWSIWLLRAQIGLIYFYAALAKMNVDWINGMPLHDWLGDRAMDGGFEKILANPFVVYLFTYTGLLYDLIVAPMLFHKRTRALGFCLSLSFHLTNYYLFNIGIFPWFMIAVTTIFFEPSWPRDFFNFIFGDRLVRTEPQFYPRSITNWQKIGVYAMVLHMSFQALFPYRTYT